MTGTKLRFGLAVGRSCSGTKLRTGTVAVVDQAALTQQMDRVVVQVSTLTLLVGTHRTTSIWPLVPVNAKPLEVME
ncbi:MAG: hypothetical protein NVSMB42_14860 [Herpetosiphon sp.]